MTRREFLVRLAALVAAPAALVAGAGGQAKIADKPLPYCPACLGPCLILKLPEVQAKAWPHLGVGELSWGRHRAPIQSRSQYEAQQQKKVRRA